MKQTCVTRLFVSMLFVWLFGFVLGSDLSFFQSRTVVVSQIRNTQVK